MLVKDLMTTGIICVQENTSLLQIAKQMKQEDVGVIPVCNDMGKILGIVTDRDLVLRGLAKDGRNPCAKDIMSTNLVCTSPEMNTHDAALLMARYQVRRLPVTRNNQLVGMLSMADIARKTIFIDEAGDTLSAICSATHG